MSDMHAGLVALFTKHFGEQVESFSVIRAHASNRQIFRLGNSKRSVIGIVSADKKENRAFVEFTKHFASFSLPVPEVYAVDAPHGLYLEQDLGDTTLYDLLEKSRTPGQPFPSEIEALYVKAVQLLPRFQVEAGRTIDFSLCCQAKKFDRGAIMAEMKLFRDDFLRRSGIQWGHRALEKDFERVADFLAEAPLGSFMHYDFQSRNLMVQNGDISVIDYQTGREGPLQYDVASLLYQARAAIPAEARSRLLQLYLDALGKFIEFDREAFLKYYHGIVFIRLMHVLGRYGQIGIAKNKEMFSQSIPFAVRALRMLLQTAPMPFHLPALADVSDALVHRFEEGTDFSAHKLRVNILSFSYRSGIPNESGEHGGGFVFDCRSLPNPGRELEYRDKTGLDKEVIEYFHKTAELPIFFSHAFALVEQAVKNYLARGFTSLTVSFGCTGGQHRSVYSAETLAAHLKEKFQVETEVNHLELTRSGLLPRR